MAENKNALAELAERLTEIPASGLMSYERVTIRKAQRIIVELAKVQDEEAALFSMEYLNPDEARRIVHQRQGNCILKCRAIAEEGVNHD